VRTLGFDKPLYILPFDHRGSFQKKIFGWSGTLSSEQTAEIAATKQVIYDGFRAALLAGVPRQKAGILVDEQFGAEILHNASAHSYSTGCPAEKSGQSEFDFEYDENFADHIEAFHPTFCKVLVRYNPEGDRVLNHRQATRLRQLSEFLHNKSDSRLMFELLVPPEKEQLERVQWNEKLYDSEIRPKLMIKTITTFRTCESNQTCGKSRDLTIARTAKGLWQLHVARDVTTLVASSWVRGEDDNKVRERSALCSSE